MKIFLVAPKNPESFWTFDRILSSLKKKCVFHNLSLPTVAGITPREHEVVLCDENVEAVNFDTDADIVICNKPLFKMLLRPIFELFALRGSMEVKHGHYLN